jgi:hypothetical protein
VSLVAVSWRNPGGTTLGSRVHIAVDGQFGAALCGQRIPAQVQLHDAEVRGIPVCQPCRRQAARGRYATARQALPAGVLEAR